MSGDNLHWHAERNDPNGLMRLINGGADVDATNTRGQTALQIAVGNPDMICALVLLRHGAVPTFSVLVSAIELGLLAVADRIINEGKVDLTQLGADDNTLLHYVAGGGTHLVPLIPKLIAAGVDVNARNGCSRTPLMLAYRELNYPAALILLENGANPTTPVRTDDMYDDEQPYGYAQNYTADDIFDEDLVIFIYLAESFRAETRN